MIDHVSVPVSDYEKSKAFYTAALKPLGYEPLAEFLEYKVCGFGKDGKPDLWISVKEKLGPNHVAILAKDESEIKAFYDAAIAAGGKDNGAPGPRTEYHPGFYGAFVHDFDGNNIEAVIHTHQPQ